LHWLIADDWPMRKPVEATGRAREGTMKLHAPAMWVFVLSLVIAVLAIVSVFVSIPYVSDYRRWVGVVAYAVLAVGNLVET
jgi:hypothetical protein